MKAQVTEDAAGLHFEIKDDGSAEYQKAAQVTMEASEREQKGYEAVRMRAEIAQLKTALADAINRPMGVIPASAEGLVSPQELEAARFRIRK
jgi:hypothetical protein